MKANSSGQARRYANSRERVVLKQELPEATFDPDISCSATSTPTAWSRNLHHRLYSQAYRRRRWAPFCLL